MSSLKSIVWVGSALKDLRAFPEDAQRRAGYELYLVQDGQEPTDWKPMSIISAGVREIRVHTGAEYRVFYLATFADAVYVLHAFEKRTRRTRHADLELARVRLRMVERDRRSS